MPEPVAESLLLRSEVGRRQFLEFVADVRPELHRYCARMLGSVVDGEDVVQETLARAYFEIGDLRAPPGRCARGSSALRTTARSTFCGGMIGE